MLWVGYGGRDHLVWHVWQDAAVLVVCGGEEQPLPAIEQQDTVEIRLRSKSTRSLVGSVTADIEVLVPGSPAWERAVPVLVTARLNLQDPAAARQRWAGSSVVVRLVPTGVLDAQVAEIGQG